MTETLFSILSNKFTMLAATLIFFVLVVKTCNFVVNKIFNNILKSKNSQQAKQLKTIKQVIQSSIVTVFIIIAILQVMSTLGIDIKPLIATAGVAGVAIGFGAKRFVEDLIMGVLILSEGQINVGDYIEIAGLKGTVEKINLKLITLRDTEGQVHYVRNGLITTVTNYTQNYGYNILTVAVPHETNIKTVYDIINMVYKEMLKDENISGMLLSDLEIQGVDKIKDSIVYILCKIKTKSGFQTTFKNQFNERIKEKLDENNIKLISTLPN